METVHQMALTLQEHTDKLPRTMADITPLEPPVDSFITATDEAETGPQRKVTGATLASLQTQTPPVTPDLPHVDTVVPGSELNDPQLYPDPPLRDRSPSPLIARHGSPESVVKTTEVYPAIMGIKTAQDALDFWSSCVEEQKRWRRELALPRPTPSFKGSRRDVTSARQVSRLNKSAGVTKPRDTSPRTAPKPVAAASTTPPRKASAPKKRIAKPKATPERREETPEGHKKHTRAAPSKNVSNQHWMEIEDFTPPVSMLDGKTHEVKWDGNAKDLGDDPDRHHLHELELRWASKLRLEAKVYLAAKRRIFKEKVRHLRMNPPKNFSKTAAQGAVTMDVNKASRLHQAFESVGWFDEALFQQYLHDVGAAE